jgi:sec-independent protein translocase protein TatA
VFNALEPWHIIVLVVVLIALFGYKRLPGAARGIGQSLRIFKAEAQSLRDHDGQDDSGQQGQAAPPQQQFAPPQQLAQAPAQYAAPQQQFAAPGQFAQPQQYAAQPVAGQPVAGQPVAQAPVAAQAPAPAPAEQPQQPVATPEQQH